MVPSGAMDQDGPTVVALHHGHATLEQKLVVVAVASRHRHATFEQNLVVAVVAPSGTKG
jgi:molybdopterin synthase catalytic subunit